MEAPDAVGESDRREWAFFKINYPADSHGLIATIKPVCVSD